MTSQMICLFKLENQNKSHQYFAGGIVFLKNKDMKLEYKQKMKNLKKFFKLVVTILFISLIWAFSTKIAKENPYLIDYGVLQFVGWITSTFYFFLWVGQNKIK